MNKKIFFVLLLLPVSLVIHSSQSDSLTKNDIDSWNQRNNPIIGHSEPLLPQHYMSLGKIGRKTAENKNTASSQLFLSIEKWLSQIKKLKNAPVED